MGIPFYFSYLIKNHRAILKKYSRQRFAVDNLFIDANPLIYNSIKSHSGHRQIVDSVVDQITQLMSTFTPQKKTFIAFDGVAPVSKLEQQRGRRYKRRFELPDSTTTSSTSTPQFNSIEITPGTPFMKYLNEELSRVFQDDPAILYTGPNECGEGEHKIFHYIRTNSAEIGEDTNVIYGLDADLIMLCLNHLSITQRLYLFRETPHFIQSIDETLEPNETYVLDIGGLSTTIQSQVKLSPTDYIFCCFLLGNDFLPHFPAINIRTGGVTKLLDTFKEIVDNMPEAVSLSLTIPSPQGVKINWNSMKIFIAELAKKEKIYILDELRLRDRKQRNHYPSSTREELQKKINDLPSYERDLEKSIQPERKGWQDRYYVSLFGLKKPPTERFIREVCNNYLEGLEWTLKYYTVECPDWRWCYKYQYPPLLEDLIFSIPESNDFEFFRGSVGAPSRRRPINEVTQLCYVLPTENLDLVPTHIREAVMSAHPEWYIGANGQEEEVDFLWAFCKYFFEAHPVLPEINVDELERIVDNANI